MAERDDMLNRLGGYAGEYILREAEKAGRREKVRKEARRALEEYFGKRLEGIEIQAERDAAAAKVIEEFEGSREKKKIIRRAKRKARPLWAKIMGRSIGAGILLFLLYFSWFFFGEPVVRIDYVEKLNQMNRAEGVPEEENAWTYYEKAITSYQEPDWRITYIIDSLGKDHFIRYFELTEEEKEKIQEWLVNNQNAWDDLREEEKEIISQCLAMDAVPYIRTLKPVRPPGFYSLNTQIMELHRKVVESGKQSFFMGTSPEDISGEQTQEISGIIEKWIQAETISVDFERGARVAALREWIQRTANQEDLHWGIFTNKEYDLFREWISENEAAAEEFAKGGSKPYGWHEYTFAEGTPEEDRWAVNLDYSSLSELRKLSKLVIWRSRLAAEHEDNAQAMAECAAILHAGRHCQQKNRILIEQFVGSAIQQLGEEEILRICQDKELMTNTLFETSNALTALYPQAYPTVDLTAEKIFIFDFVQRCYTEGWPGGGHLVGEKFISSSIIDQEYKSLSNIKKLEFKIGIAFCGMILAKRNETLKVATDYYDQMQKRMEVSTFENKISKKEFCVPELKLYPHALLRILMPALERAGELSQRSKSLHEATLTVLALKRWKLEKGSYPETLKELVEGEYLGKEPADPYAPGAMRYERRGEDFMLYSVGADFEDNGGVETEENPWGDGEEGGDRVFWPVAEGD